MLTLTTWNVNGIRAREPEVLTWIDQHRPDVLCLQEVKASPDQVPAGLRELPDYWCYWHGHKGYSGVALHLLRERFPERPTFAHPDFDHETRIVTARAGSLVFASTYVPNGGKSFSDKTRFLNALASFVKTVHDAGQSLVLVGDLNVAREERDVHPTLRNPRQVGQTPNERALLEQIIGADLVDLSRQFHPSEDQLFTWWAPWRNMRARNMGWRLDYVLCSTALAQKATSCEVFPDFGNSDHAPVLAAFDVELPSLEEKEKTEMPEKEAVPKDPSVSAEGQLKLF